MEKKHLNMIAIVTMVVGLSIASVSLGVSLAEPRVIVLDEYVVGVNDSEKLASGWYLGNHTIWEPFWWAYIPGEGDSDNARSASFTLNHKAGNAKVLSLDHVDGYADDSFDVYVNGVFVYHYTALRNNEEVITDVPLPANIGANVGGGRKNI